MSEDLNNVKLFHGAKVEIPNFELQKTYSNHYRWIPFGNDNIFPLRLKEFATKSVTHSGMLETLKSSIMGNGFIDKERGSGNVERSASLLFIRDKMERDFSSDILSSVSRDVSVYGAFALQVVWTLDGSQIANVYHIPVEKVRKVNPKRNDKYESDGFFLSPDWANYQSAGLHYIPSFDPKKGSEEGSQLLYVGMENNMSDEYGLPNYVSALNWIALEEELSIYNLSVVSNAAIPSTIFAMPTTPNSPEEKEDIYREMSKQYQGADNSGRFMIMFTGNDDNVDINKLIHQVESKIDDEQWKYLQEEAKQQILTAHGATSPVLAGIPKAGSIGGDGNEIKTAWEMYNKQVASKYQRVVLNVFNYLLQINNLNPVEIESWYSKKIKDTE